MQTDSANEVKAGFDDIYAQATPHAYYGHLARLDYSICDEARPFCVAAAEIIRRRRQRVRMFDIGCSYGINSATIRNGLSFAELNRLFELNVPRDPEQAPQVARAALASSGVRCEMSCGGLDVSRPAIDFALQAGILEHGVVADLETSPDALTTADRAWLADCDLILSTGAIGYVTDRTLRALLEAMGAKAADATVLLTVLRVFDYGPIESALAEHGLATALVPHVLLPQRRFEDEKEQRGIVDVLEQQGLDATLERGGRHFARMLVAAEPSRLPRLLAAMASVADRRPTVVSPVEPQTEPATEAMTQGG